MAIYDVNGNVIIDDTDAVESYFEEEVADTIDKVRALQTEPCLTFFLCTDVHYASLDITTFPHTINNMKAVAKGVRADGIICLGDMTDGNVAQSTTIGRLNTIMPLMMNSGLPVYFTAGNHDCNAYVTNSNVFTTSQIYQYYYSRTKNEVFADWTSHGVNFYKDFDEYKIRMISLDATNTDYGSTPHYRYPENTVTWFTNLLPTTPAGYTVLLLTHLSPWASHNWNNTVPNNATDVQTAISSWAAVEGNTMVLLMGHTHADFSFNNPILEIGFNCEKCDTAITADVTVGPGEEWPEGSKRWKRVLGTVLEDSWDAVVIRPISRKINTIRFGAGEDREFAY